MFGRSDATTSNGCGTCLTQRLRTGSFRGGPRGTSGAWSQRCGAKQPGGPPASLVQTRRVTRPELHEGSSTRRVLRWHDLRATGITWMAVRGDAPQLIQSRAGHTDFATTLAYVRAAEALAAGFGEVFPALPPRLLESSSKRQVTISVAAIQPKTSTIERGGRDLFATARSPALLDAVQARLKSRTMVHAPWTERGGRDLEPSEKPLESLENKPLGGATGEPIPSSSEPLATSRVPVATSPVADHGPTDAELERAIVAAVTGGVFDVARVLSGQLEDRRRARGGNVIDLSGRRGR